MFGKVRKPEDAHIYDSTDINHFVAQSGFLKRRLIF